MFVLLHQHLTHATTCTLSQRRLSFANFNGWPPYFAHRRSRGAQRSRHHLEWAALQPQGLYHMLLDLCFLSIFAKGSIGALG